MSEKIIQLNEEVVKSELKELVRKSVEETLNELLDKEADELIGAGKYERTAHCICVQNFIKLLFLLNILTKCDFGVIIKETP